MAKTKKSADIDIAEVVERVVEELDGDDRVEDMVKETLTKIANGTLDIDVEDEGDEVEDDLVTKSEVAEMIEDALEGDGDGDDEEETEEEEEEEDADSEDDSEDAEDGDEEKEEEPKEKPKAKSVTRKDIERIVKREIKDALKGVMVMKGEKRSVVKGSRPTGENFDPEKCERAEDIPVGWVEKVETGEVSMKSYEKLPEDVRTQLLAKSFKIGRASCRERV